MVGYSVEIKEASKELSAKERIALKDTTSAIKLDVACDEGDVVITPSAFAVLGIHNEKSDNKDYNNYIIMGEDGQKFVTGSDSLWNSFMDIYNEMKNEDEPWAIRVYKVDSKNYKGKKFLTCAIV